MQAEMEISLILEIMYFQQTGFACLLLVYDLCTAGLSRIRILLIEVMQYSHLFACIASPMV